MRVCCTGRAGTCGGQQDAFGGLLGTLCLAQSRSIWGAIRGKWCTASDGNMWCSIYSSTRGQW